MKWIVSHFLLLILFAVVLTGCLMARRRAANVVNLKQRFQALSLPIHHGAGDTNWVQPTNPIVLLTPYDRGWSNCYWQIQESHDLSNWTVLAKNLYGPPDPSVTLDVTNRGCDFFRSKKQEGWEQ